MATQNIGGPTVRKGGYRTTPVAIERVRKLLRTEDIAGRRCGKECVID